MTKRRKQLLASIARKKSMHQSTALDYHKLILLTLRQLKREIRANQKR